MPIYYLQACSRPKSSRAMSMLYQHQHWRGGGKGNHFFLTSGLWTMWISSHNLFIGQATECDPEKCNSKDCRCPSSATPGNLAKDQTPKIILLAMDDGITQEKHDVLLDIIYGKANPNGCPVLGTFFISADYTFHDIAKELYAKGRFICTWTVGGCDEVLQYILIPHLLFLKIIIWIQTLMIVSSTILLVSPFTQASTQRYRYTNHPGQQSEIH